MIRRSVIDAGLHFGELVDRVSTEGIVVELQQSDRVVAKLSPADALVPFDGVGYCWSEGDYDVLRAVEQFSESTDANY